MVQCGATVSDPVAAHDDNRCSLATSGFSFSTVSKLPTAAESTKICANSYCLAVIAAVKKAHPTECVLSSGYMLYEEILTPIEARCAGKPLTVTPAPTKAPVTTTASPLATTTAPPPTSTTSAPPAAASNETSSPLATVAPAGSTTTAAPSATTTEPSAAPSATTTEPSTGHTNTATNTTTAHSGSNVTLIVAIVGGVIVAVAFIGFLVFRSRQKAKKDHHEPADYRPRQQERVGKQSAPYTDIATPNCTTLNQGGGGGGVSSNGSMVSTVPTQANSQVYSSQGTASSRASATAVSTLIADDTIQRAWIPPNHLQVGDILSHGAYGEVLRGVFEGEPVAIKRLLPARRQDMKEIAAFLEEAKLMTTLRHDNIVRLVGVAWNTQAESLQESVKDLSIVCELMEGGDLRSMLSHADTNNAPTGFHSDNIKIAIDIANALTYMHGIKPSAIVHRDLKSKNVLLTRDLRAKLTDFGISRERADATMTAGVGSFLWMAPEIVFGRRYDEKADVFSFGVLLSELDTHKLPYSHAVEHGSDRKLTEMMIVKMVSEGSLSVAFSSDADAEVVELARACVATSALLRPSAEAVLYRLREIGERMAQTKPSSMLEDTNAFSLTTTRRMY